MYPIPVLGDSSRRYKGKWVDIASEITFLASPRARPDPVMGRAQFLAHSFRSGRRQRPQNRQQWTAPTAYWDRSALNRDDLLGWCKLRVSTVGWALAH